MSTTHTRSKSPVRKRAAFTLVEVALALGIAGFAIVSLFGSFSVGLNTIHDATVDMTNAQIIAQVSSTLQQTPFDQLETFAGTLPSPPNPLYFDLAGRQLTNPAGASQLTMPAGTLYVVDLLVTATGSSTYPGAPANLATSAKTVQISVYPVNAAPQNKTPSSQAVLLIPKS